MTRAAAIATVGGLGRLGPAPGTVTSLVTVFAAWGIALAGNRAFVLFAGIAAMAVGGWAAELYARERDRKDPQECVIDEVGGQFIACAFAPRTLLAYALAFLLFRALDILKPWPIGATQRLPGGLGIVADDLVAGLLAGIVIAILVQTDLIRA